MSEYEEVVGRRSASSKVLAGILVVSLMSAGAIGYDQGVAFYKRERLALIRRVLEEEFARHQELARMDPDQLRKKALQIKLENEDLKSRMITIASVLTLVED